MKKPVLTLLKMTGLKVLKVRGFELEKINGHGPFWTFGNFYLHNKIGSFGPDGKYAYQFLRDVAAIQHSEWCTRVDEEFDQDNAAGNKRYYEALEQVDRWYAVYERARDLK